MFENDILRNSSQNNLNVLRGDFLKGLGDQMTPRPPGALLAKNMGHRSSHNYSTISPFPTWTHQAHRICIRLLLTNWIERGGGSSGVRSMRNTYDGPHK